MIFLLKKAAHNMVYRPNAKLNGITSKPANTGESDPNDDDASSKDDLPLLESAAEGIQELEKKFAAFVRNDVYGSMGCGKLPLKEKLLLGIALVTLLPIRLVLVMTILVVYYLICRIFTLFSTPNLEDEQEDFAHLGGCRRAVIVQSGRFLSSKCLGCVYVQRESKSSDFKGVAGESK
ncbi:Lysophospholipid acyltransferase LPEAT1 [Hibiscus syriacus]|uniref:Lysophospholipid acyltransferase LPEAT1 n=1 Tax=Hibiscus syriacus TaxID=106335 RepID=A0A6A3A9W0_HIBSY|nr:Lysophospholipid acyltransferase LPEAT1 [Hibiscus syriacus]